MSGKYAYIDSFRLRMNFPKFKEAQGRFDEEVQQWNLELENERTSIERMESEFAEQSLLFSDSEQRDKSNTVAARKVHLQDRANEIFGPEGRAEKRNIELTRPLIEEINQALSRVAVRDGYAMILDSASGNIAYASQELDVTDSVLQELEKAH